MAEELRLDKIDPSRLPEHVAIIMDGNGRWAKARGLERSAGHVEGVNAVRSTTRIASDLGIKYLTLYTFSTENWNRPKEEVDALMHLIVFALERELPEMLANNVRMAVVGDLDRMPEAARRRLEATIGATSHCTGMTLILAISYSSRWEIARACREIAREAKEGTIDPESIDDATVAAHLATAAYPDPDLLIRTGGDLRVSNFLLWQIAYSEIEVVDKFWPDYTKQDFVDNIVSYQRRERRYGMTSEQVN